MSQSMARSSWSSLSRCQSCSVLPPATRSFGTSRPLSKIGPESPKFIEIPQLVQPYERTKRTIKGVLPTPRNIFPRRGGDEKISVEYLASATPEPTAEHQLVSPATPYVAWKRKMAETRRNNLREGLVGLHERKQKDDRFQATRSRYKQQDRERRLHAPMREDERLTNSTITATMSRMQIGNVPDPRREARLIEAAGRVREKREAMEERRQDALHTLYMNARSFITTEAQLETEIDRIFTDKPFEELARQEMYGRPNAKNIWDAVGAPPTVLDMLTKVNGSRGTAMEKHKGSELPTSKRMLRLAEELTGGKMDSV